jgi:hypothetical protein
MICAEAAYERVLLSNPIGPLTISISPDGKIKKVTGEQELRARQKKLLTSKMSRAKRHRDIIADGTNGKTKA